MKIKALVPAATLMWLAASIAHGQASGRLSADPLAERPGAAQCRCLCP
jgi:hypothetical protein